MSRKTTRKTLCTIKLLVILLFAGCHAGDGYQERQTQAAPQGGLPAALSSRLVRVADLPVLGDAKATLALIEVTDYQCPFCQAHFNDTLPLLKREFIDTGRLNYYVLDYPLPGHEFAAEAALAASCAGDQQAYWPFHDALFAQSAPRSEKELQTLVGDLALDAVAFAECMVDRRYSSLLDYRRSTALGLGVQGTPTFVLGRLLNGRLVTDITVLPGIHNIDQFRTIIGQYDNESGVGL